MRTIYYHQPIGRRALATELNVGERIIRNEVNFLKELELLDIDLKGMNVTKKGKQLIDELHELYKGLKGIVDLQKNLEAILGVKRIIIVPGNSSEDELILKEMGKITSSNIKKLIQPHDIIGITGGNTMANVAEQMPQLDNSDDVMVIPARGGLGSELETQANAIAAKIGKKLGGNYKLLNVPDSLGKEALEVIIKNDEVKEAIELINNINILVFGIGRADTMAYRRKLPIDRIESILELGAVAEAFGHYFNLTGEEIWEYETIGISIEKFKSTKHVIGVAGGAEKAEAIIAISSVRKDITIVTDESAAKKIVELAKEG
ncbi:sugar-binding domain-containing protein [Tissierella sp. Yu-01]|nr:sugar-binding domain-containing protein [Tissierella sp. Yu-01]WFA10205.1 sugar-binding domain-containing protein [Tissierella sp. Yu-01]